MNRLTCPTCEKPLSFWNVAKAPTPFHLKCDHCHAKLRFEKHAGSIFGVALGFGVIIGFVTARLSAGALILALIAAVAVFEAAFFLIASGMNLKLIPRETA
jgi:hypothetical protein